MSGHASDRTVSARLLLSEVSSPNCGQYCNHLWHNEPDNRTAKILGDAVMYINAVQPVVAVDFCIASLYGEHSSRCFESHAPGYMVDSVSRNFATNLAELGLICSSLKKPTIACKERCFAADSYYQWCQYDFGKHRCCRRKRLGFVTPACRTNSNKICNIFHLVLEESCWWIVGLSIRRMCKHLRLNDNRVQLRAIDGTPDSISVVYYKTHSFLYLICFLPDSAKLHNAFFCSQLIL